MCETSVFNLLLVSRHIERIADHSTNVAEEVIYLIDGEIVRHEIGKEEKMARTAPANAQAGAVSG